MKIPNLIIVAGSLALTLGLVACQSNTAANSANPTKQTVQAQAKRIDWQGTYAGRLPCASCEGIESKISLYDNGLYSKTDTYLDAEGSRFTENGEVTWNAATETVTLTNDSEVTMYKVTPNSLILLDVNGQQAAGALADKYELLKQ